MLYVNELIHIIAVKDNRIYDLQRENKKLKEDLCKLISAVYEHCVEGTELMDIAEEIDKK